MDPTFIPTRSHVAPNELFVVLKRHYQNVTKAIAENERSSLALRDKKGGFRDIADIAVREEFLQLRHSLPVKGAEWWMGSRKTVRLGQTAATT